MKVSAAQAGALKRLRLTCAIAALIACGLSGGDLDLAAATAPGANGMLGYTSCLGYPIYTINADGSGVAPLIGGLHPEIGYLSMAFSPDGNRVATAVKSASAPPGTALDLTRLELFDLGGQRVSTVVDDPSMNFEPAFSPDGSRIAFISNRDTPPGHLQGEVYMVDLATGHQTRLTQVEGAERRPVFSPDGTRVLFSRDYGRVELFVVDVASGEETRLTDTLFLDETEASWAPDGSRIVYAAEAIYTMRPDGSDVERLTSSAADETRPVWSPDGRRIAFVRGAIPFGQIFTMAAGGGDEHAVTDAHIPLAGQSNPCLNDWQPCLAGVTTRCASVTPAAGGSPVPALGPTTTAAPTPRAIPDTRAPRTALTRPRLSHHKRVSARLRCDEACKVLARATVVARRPRHRRALTLTSPEHYLALGAGQTRTLRFTVPARARRLRILRVTVSGRVRDVAGNQATFKRTLVLR